MPGTFPATWAEAGVGRREGVTLPAARHSHSTYAPEFVLLDTGGPRPAALLLAFSFMSALLFLTIIVTRPRIATPSLHTVSITDIYIAHEPIFLAENPEHPNSRASAAHSFRPAEPAPEPHPLSASIPLAAAPVAPPVAAGDIPKPAPEALAAFPLPRLIEREASLAAGLAALTPNQRRALPRVSIRVNAEWLEALPETQEKLYFSLAQPQADSEVLAYVPASHNFALERPLLPLWQIRDSQQVPALAALRSDAAGRLGVPPELVGLYTWHPPVFENALRMFVLERMEQMGVPMDPGDWVTVRLASGPAGCVMNLEPIRGGGSQ